MPNTEPKWVKFGDIKNVAFLGKDVIAIASGIHVLFINLNTKDEKVEKFDNKDRGEGACCLSGHPVVPIFAISERRSNPKISIFTFPEIHKVSNCTYKKEDRINGFLSSAFAGTDYLLTLSSFPNFQLTVWLWRTGEHLTTSDTEIMDDFQYISISASSPHRVAQWGQLSGKLMIYEMSVCSKMILLLPITSSIPNEKITSSSWTYDGNLLLCDNLGNILLMYSDGKRRLIIVKSENIEDLKWRPLVVAFRCGVAIVNSNSQLTFYRKSAAEPVKSGSFWDLIWSIDVPSQAAYLARHSQRDSLLISIITGEIFEVSVGDDDIPRLQIICHQGSGYLRLIPINPSGRHIAVINGFNQLIILEGHNGKILGNSCLDFYEEVSHPSLPLLTFATKSGKCIIISVNDASDPIILKSYYLIREPLTRIKFSWAATVLGITNFNGKKWFILQGFEEMKFEIMTYSEISQKVIDFLIFEMEDKSLKVLLLIESHPGIACGSNIIICCIKKFDTKVHQSDYIIELPNIFTNLSYSKNSNIIIGNPYLTRQLYFIEIKEDFNEFVLIEAVALSHRLRSLTINTDYSSIITFGYDGLVTILNGTNIHENSMTFTSHHRYEGGTKFGVACCLHNIIITLGKNGNLVATKINQVELRSNLLSFTDREISFEIALQMLCSSTRPEISGKGNLTWLEWNEYLNLIKERDEMSLEKSTITLDFQNLKQRLKVLLDVNEEESDAQLLIQHFDLNTLERMRKIHENLNKKENVREKLEIQIKRQEEISEFLRKLCWDSMPIPSCAITSLDGKIRVDNYALPVVTREEENCRLWEKFSIELTRQMASIDNTCAAKLDVPSDWNEDDEEEKFAMTGTTTHRWIQEDPYQIKNQIYKHGSYIEGVGTSFFTRIREEKLRNYFNNLFEEMRKMKAFEIELAESRIARINYCSNELEQMFGVKCNIDHSWLQLKWDRSERPQTIIKIEDEEVFQVMTDSAKALSVARIVKSETEKQTQSYADNSFREMCLDQMMDGVLKVRWEDEIKKDVPKPNCLSKDPSCYTEEDSISINKYEIALTNLGVQRLKYKTILETEMSEVQEALKQSLSNFNRELERFYLKRIKIESSVLQETLMRFREFLRHQFRLQRIKDISRLESKELLPAMKEFKKSMDDAGLSESIVSEMKIRYDNLIKREKLLEGKFRGEFPDLKQPMVEHLLRHYKKRPRIGQLTCTSITFLTETSRCILSGEKSEILPRECLDFLKDMHILDIMPNSLPNQIDNNHWHLLCKLRRTKVEIETKSKICAVELAEAEQTLGFHQRTIQNLQNRIQQLKETIEDCKRLNFEKMRDMEVQLVVTMGQIETELNGNPRELSNSVFRPFNEVLKINDSIINAGRKKLLAMKQTIENRQTIEWKEWRHKCMQMTLEDMREELKMLQRIKVTKEIQKFLMRHRRVVELEKDSEIWEKSQTSTKKRYHRMLENEKLILAKAIRQINQWQNRNNNLANLIEEKKLQCFKESLLANDESRVKNERFQRIKFKSMMKRNKKIKKVQDNYLDLVALQAQLELLRLKTYPTLRLNNLNKYIRK